MIKSSAIHYVFYELKFVFCYKLFNAQVLVFKKGSSTEMLSLANNNVHTSMWKFWVNVTRNVFKKDKRRRIKKRRKYNTS